MSREPAQQHWPWLKKMALAAPAMAASRSPTSLKTMLGDLPPSSRLTFFKFPGRGADNDFSNFGRAGERDLVHIVVRGQSCTRSFAEAGDDVDDAFRNSSVEKNFAEAKSGERRLFGGFEDDAISSGERRREFPRGHEQRKIPRNDLADDADRLAQRERVKLAAGRVGHADGNGVAFDLGRPAGHVMEQVGGERHVRHARDRARFAVIQRFDFGEFIRVFEDEVADAPDEFAAFAGRHATPRAGFESAASGGNGALDIFLVAFGRSGEDRGIRGIEDIKSLAGCGRNPFAVDQVVFGLGQPGSNLRAGPRGFGAW